MKRKDIPKATPRAFHPGGMVPPSYGPRPIPGVGTAMPGTPRPSPYTPVQADPSTIPGYGGQANPFVGGGGKPAIPVDDIMPKPKPRPRRPRRPFMPRGTGGMPRMPRRLPRGMSPTRVSRAR